MGAPFTGASPLRSGLRVRLPLVVLGLLVGMAVSPSATLSPTPPAQPQVGALIFESVPTVVNGRQPFTVTVAVRDTAGLPLPGAWVELQIYTKPRPGTVT